MDIQNISYTNSSNTQIKADVDGTTYFLPAQDGNPIYDEIIEQGLTITAYSARDIVIEEVRSHRNNLLSETDYLDLPNAVLPSGVILQDILDYRQALRDITTGLDLTGIKSISGITWPTKPF
jgi:hypothetical protein